MKTYLRNLFETVSQSLWLMPAVSIALAMGTAYGMLYWEDLGLGDWEDLPLINRSSRETSLAIVGAIVGSLITVAGVTFSITIVSLTLASSQFGPRLLRNFLRSGSSQVTLGALIGSFIYGILIMPAMDENWEAGKAHPSVTLMILLACVCVCLIVHYIHHVATSIQADSLVASVYRELERKIDTLQEREEEDEDSRPPNWTGPCSAICARRSGYLTAIDQEGLASVAKEQDARILILKRAGHFAAKGEVIAKVYGAETNSSYSKSISEAIFLGDKRTPEQNLEFLIDQLVELALRAISPGINDPNTAIVCIDYLSAALLQVTGKSLPKSKIEDESGELRVYCPRSTFEGLVDDTFNQLRQSGVAYPEILIRIANSLERLGAGLKPSDERKKNLRKQLDQIVEREKSTANPRTAGDREDIDTAIASCRKVLEDSAS
ncbi:DUF2254 domain-containing protein [Pelagicoccus sp. SDUM812003]|uniref:DUF2254 domain-containing protein n=1 Tax=Pelagicoccus sp. SDUM812003 TaxID=3041267 RepID=UPI002810451A|nr:DUF2254 domain-containing protein [Pelagicoccus sp. SDUM812003]MDQ8202940.1 DUF2254 domain-containing protein [Pelagicoccus sp. SDUM812003]